MTQPTQVRHPWRATARTVAAALIAALPIVPVVVHELGLESVPWVAAALVVIAGATRVLAMPRVDSWLQRYVPWLAARPGGPVETPPEVDRVP